MRSGITSQINIVGKEIRINRNLFYTRLMNNDPQITYLSLYYNYWWQLYYFNMLIFSRKYLVKNFQIKIWDKLSLFSFIRKQRSEEWIYLFYNLWNWIILIWWNWFINTIRLLIMPIKILFIFGSLISFRDKIGFIKIDILLFSFFAF